MKHYDDAVRALGVFSPDFFRGNLGLAEKSSCPRHAEVSTPPSHARLCWCLAFPFGKREGNGGTKAFLFGFLFAPFLWCGIKKWEHNSLCVLGLYFRDSIILKSRKPKVFSDFFFLWGLVSLPLLFIYSLFLISHLLFIFTSRKVFHPKGEKHRKHRLHMRFYSGLYYGTPIHFTCVSCVSCV